LRAINANFITGLNHPVVVAVLGNTLFVASTNAGNGTVGEYNAETGATINANFISSLNGPNGLAFLGNTIFVASFNANTIGTYDAKTGTPINASFITGLDGPVGLAVLGNLRGQITKERAGWPASSPPQQR
jgi:WD40 repeat protein